MEKIGIDVHKSASLVCIRTETGQLLPLLLACVGCSSHLAVPRMGTPTAS